MFTFADTKLKQQKLPAWQPILTADTVLPLLFAIGVSFIPLGIGFLITANNVCHILCTYFALLVEMLICF